MLGLIGDRCLFFVSNFSHSQRSSYFCRAKSDRKRYEEQMAEYHPPDRQANRKRNKTGYNMFFSSHVLRLKQTESGVPSERGSVARLVGTAWKLLAPEEKAYYEREADKHNGMNPVKDGDDDDDEEEMKRQHMEYQMQVAAHTEMHMHGVPPPMHGAIPHPQHDLRHQHHPYYPPPPPHMYGPPPPYAHYDYSQHHRHQARAQGYQHGYPPPPPRHPYEG
jgi:HMG-box domain